ncbi:MAG: 4'-phosphopantetheinyl transferase [Opitutales bacterium]
MESVGQELASLIPSDASAWADVIQPEEVVRFRVEGDAVSTAVPVRRNAFLAGRRCAREALRLLDGPVCALPPGPKGPPRWPDGWVGSISHTRELACAVVSENRSVVCLGVDIERTDRIRAGAMRRVTHPKESAFANGDPVRASLLFSAKEAFYKAQFPLWEAALNFQDVALKIDPASGRASIAELSAAVEAGLRERAGDMCFRFGFVDAFVLSVCWLPVQL